MNSPLSIPLVLLGSVFFLSPGCGGTNTPPDETDLGTPVDASVDAADDAGVVVDAGPPTIGGTITLPEGASVTLQFNGGGDLVLTAPGMFSFVNLLAQDTPYAVTVAAVSDAIACEVFEGEGFAAAESVSDIRVVCGAQSAFFTPGTHTWTVPAGVTSVSVVVGGAGGGGGAFSGLGAGGGGGGELCFLNDIAVVPGDTITVVVGEGGALGYSDDPTRTPGCCVLDGRPACGCTDHDGETGGDSSFGASLVAHGGSGFVVVYGAGPVHAGLGTGGSGGATGVCGAGGSASYVGSGGGAGGYGGAGGLAGDAEDPASPGTSGGGGGGRFGSGGGVGLQGQGADGIAPGGHGSRVGPADPVVAGGGGSSDGMHGGVRIVWGLGRAFPATATADQ